MSWYEVVRGDELLQGDIIPKCPVPSVPELEAAVADGNLEEGQTLSVEITLVDVRVITQSCDLENERVDEVVLAQVVDWEKAVELELSRGNQVVRSKNFRKALVDGNIPGVTLLHSHDQDPRLAWSVVDFHRLFVLPRSVVKAAAVATGDRLRLLPPYREHLGQAFARYFMRVGLPHDARAFITEGA